MQSARREPAPEPLRLVQEFLNTTDIEDGTDDLGDPPRLRTWLASRYVIGPRDRVTRSDWQRAIEVREAIRALALANNGEPLDRAAVATLNRAADRTAIRTRFTAAGLVRSEPGGTGVDRAIGVLFAAVANATIDGTWARLKACRRHSCRWAFYDHSRNRSGTWCAMAVCGNREKVGSYRRRRKRLASSRVSTRNVVD